MQNQFINITKDNIASEHLCCIIRSRAKHIGIEAKKKWMSDRLDEGHVFRKLDAKGTVFIEYAPLEKAWVPIIGKNYFYIYCLWVYGEFKGKGYGKALMEYCIEDAKSSGKSGICMLGSAKQKTWLSDQNFAKGFGFKSIDSTQNGYELLCLSFDGTAPSFAPSAKKEAIDNKNLTIYYDLQCPYILQNIGKIQRFCDENLVSADFIKVESLEQAKNLPCVFNNYAVFFDGEFRTVNLLDEKALLRILKK